MTITRKLALVLFLVCLSSRYSNAQNLSMGDDGYAAVNLNFAFPFYDKTFNQAYMYDNGVLSFLQPGTPNALSPWQWSSQPLNQTQAKYFIAPLWADIAPVAQTTYNVSSTATTHKFSWNNIAEYYSQGSVLRLNSFSVELNANGDIATKYTGLNLRTSNISIGYKGDTDYTQIAYNPFGYVLSSQTDWTANTSTVTAAPIAPKPIIKEDPVVATIVEPTPAPTAPEPVQTTTTTTIAPSAASTTTATVASPVAAAQPQQVATAIAEPTKTTEKKQAAKAQNVDSGTAVAEAAIAIALTSASQSVNEQQITTTSIKQTNSNDLSQKNTVNVTLLPPKITQEVVNSNTQTNTTKNTFIIEQKIDSGIDTQKDSNNTALSLFVKKQESTESSNTTYTATERKDVVDTVLLDSLYKPEMKQDQKDKGINKAVGVNLELGQPIPGFSAYATLVLPDNAFYAPKEVYRNQKVVDNARLLKSLSSDRLYDRLLEQQYER